MLNRVVLIGRLTKDPELRYTPNGNATCNFALACDRNFKNAQNEKEVDFIPIVVPPFRGKLAELVTNYLAKGRLAAIEGSIRVRSFDANGQKRWVTEVEAESVKFLSPKGESEASREGAERPYGQEVPITDDVPY